jgi:chromosome segregation ATPase
MKAIEILKDIEESKRCGVKPTLSNYNLEDIKKAIKELDAYITNYQGIKRRLESTIKTLAVFENENKSLVKTLEKYNEEMIELRKENQDLKNSNNELLEGLKSTQKRLEEWLEKCK